MCASLCLCALHACVRVCDSELKHVKGSAQPMQGEEHVTIWLKDGLDSRLGLKIPILGDHSWGNLGNPLLYLYS